MRSPSCSSHQRARPRSDAVRRHCDGHPAGHLGRSGAGAKHVSRGVREPGVLLPIRAKDGDDGASPGDRQREGDAGARPIPCALAPDQMIDASCQDVEVFVVDPRVVRCRVDIRPREDRDQSKGRIGIQAVAHRQASQARPDPDVARDGPKQPVERRPTGGHVAREQLTFRRPIALADGQRGHLTPQQQPLTEFHEPFRRLATADQLR